MHHACVEINNCLSSSNKTVSLKVVQVAASEMTTPVVCKSTLQMSAL